MSEEAVAMEGGDAGTGARRVLLTALGTQAREATYRWGKRAATSRLAPMALVELATEPLDEVLAVCTSEAARSALPILEEGLQGGVPVRPVTVPDATRADDLPTFVEAVASAVAQCSRQAGVRLWVDLTHGFRHHAVLLYATSLYLASLDRVDIEHVWYAPFTSGPEGADLLDLQPLLVLPQLVHAVRELRETGSARWLARLLAPEPKHGGDAQRALDGLTRALVAGLPLEAGVEAHEFLAAGARANDPPGSARLLRRALRSRQMPLADRLVDEVADSLRALALGTTVKTDVALDEGELQRQARLIDRLIDWGMLHTAVGLLREWVVSWAIWAKEGGGPVAGEDWLRDTARRRAERSLNSLRIYKDDADLRELLRSDQVELAGFWDGLAKLRNAYMHFGMQTGHVDPCKARGGSDLHKKWKEVARQWAGIKTELPRTDLAVAGGGGPVLVSPLGLSPGVLCNAIRAARAAGREPGHVVVICSAESQALAGEALERAQWGGPVTYRQLDDPFVAVGAMRPQKGQQLPGDPELRRLLAGAEEVLVNLTGGTTAMAVVAQQLADAAGAFERPVRRFVLIDRRSSDEQRRDPWAECDSVFL